MPNPSMGPPPFGGGNKTTPWTSIARICHFNGATAFRWWKQNNPLDEYSQDLPLQWGHRLAVVETLILAGLVGRVGIEPTTPGLKVRCSTS